MFRVLAIGNSFSQDATAYLAQLAAGGADVGAQAAAHGGVDAQLRQERLKTFDVGGIRSGIRRAVHGIDGNKVHVRTHALDELCQPAGRLRAVVHAVHH